MDAIQRLSATVLSELADLLESDPAFHLSERSVQQIAGATDSGDIVYSLNGLLSDGWSAGQLSLLLRSIAQAKRESSKHFEPFDLVLSGPEVAQIPTRDTAAVIYSMCEEAEKEILLVGYAIHDGRRIFKHIAERMSLMKTLKVRFLLNIERKWRDTSLESEIVKRFASDFISKHWPWASLPEVYYDPRSLSLDPTQRASLHAKSVIVDNRLALITSANFTEAAHFRNIEAGVIIRYESMVQRLYDYFDGLCQSTLKKCPLESVNQ